MSKDWYYPREPEKLLTATRGWPWQRAAFYALLLDVLYQLGGAVEDDVDKVRTWIGLDLKPKEFRDHRDALIRDGKLYRAADGMLRNPRVDRFFSKRGTEQKANSSEKTAVTSPKQAKFSVGNSVKNESGFDGKKPKQNNAPPHQNDLLSETLPARARDSYSYSNSKTDESSNAAKVIVEVEQIAKALGQERGRYWERDYARMIEDGLTFEAILEAAKAHRGDPLKGIYALKGLAWHKQRNGVKSEPSSPAQSVTLTDQQWGERLASLLRIGQWVASEAGPPPTREGHLVPAHLWAQWDKLWRAQGSHPIDEVDYSANIVRYPAERPSPLFRSFWEPQA